LTNDSGLEGEHAVDGYDADTGDWVRQKAHLPSGRQPSYKKPTQKIPTTIILCFNGSCSFKTEGIGMQKMRMSVAMLMPEEKYQMGSVSRHVPAMLGTMMPMGRHASPRRAAWTHAQRQT
jgi:hypothetical protein